MVQLSRSSVPRLQGAARLAGRPAPIRARRLAARGPLLPSDHHHHRPRSFSAQPMISCKNVLPMSPHDPLPLSPVQTPEREGEPVAGGPLTSGELDLKRKVTLPSWSSAFRPEA